MKMTETAMQYLSSNYERLLPGQNLL